MGYNPKSYWEKRGKKYKHVENIDELDNLYNLLNSISIIDKGMSILDVGSGDGREYIYLNRKGIVNKDNFTMCDFSDSFRSVCYRNTKIVPDAWDGVTLPYKDNSFDIVVSFSVLLHVLPKNIDNFLKEHVRVSKKYLFIATWYEGGEKPKNRKKVADYCFEHDYYNLFKNNNLGILKEIECYPDNGKLIRRNWWLEKI